MNTERKRKQTKTHRREKKKKKNPLYLCLAQSKAQPTHVNTTRPTSEKETKKNEHWRAV